MIFLSDPDHCVREIVKRVGPKIVVATPLGLGKPIQLLNALYRHAKKDPSIRLTILTALSLVKPSSNNNLVKRFIDPYVQRVYDDYEDLSFEMDRRAHLLPRNVRVVEFFLAAGYYLDNAKAQQDLIYCNYTHVVRDMLSYSINVIAALVASQEESLERFSLSCNADLTKDLLKACPKALLVGQINNNLPFMYGEQAEIGADKFYLVLDNADSHRKLFSIPKQGLTNQDYLIGLYASTLIQDDGCLQIGIGNLSDALVFALILRHKENHSYRQILKDIQVAERELGPFNIGLFALTEMLVDGYWELYQTGILKKIISDSEGSHVAHAGFFIGSNAFYQHLKNMPKEERRLFSMRSISEINQLYGDEQERRNKRTNARFVNTCIKATLLGEIASDTLNSGLTISGVGGQYNFVAMAHELVNARSIMLCRSIHGNRSTLESNVVFSYSPSTIPRHLRDIVVTEYGIADIRGKTDEDVIKAMLNIADSRFQKELLHQAKAAKKIPSDYKIPAEHANNLPALAFEKIKKYKTQLKAFPFGSEYTEHEIALLDVLHHIQAASGVKKLQMMLKGLATSPSSKQNALLERMDLAKARSLKEHALRALLLAGMNQAL